MHAHVRRTFPASLAFKGHDAVEWLAGWCCSCRPPAGSKAWLGDELIKAKVRLLGWLGAHARGSRQGQGRGVVAMLTRCWQTRPRHVGLQGEENGGDGMASCKNEGWESRESYGEFISGTRHLAGNKGGR